MIEGQIRVESTRPGKWRVVLDGPAGRVERLVDPLVDADLETVQDIPSAARKWTAFVARLSPNKQFRVPLTALEGVGAIIRDRLLGWSDAVRWIQRMEQKAQERSEKLRFVIELDADADGLASIPIELAFDSLEFLFKRRHSPAVRCDANVEWAPSVRLVRGDHLVIVTAHSDTEPHPDREELARHALAVRESAAKAGLSVTCISDATPELVHAKLTDANSGRVDMLYVACHGSEDPTHRGRLHMRGRSATGDEVGTWAADHAKRLGPIKAIVVCACSSAAAPFGGGTTGMAQWLLRRGGARATLGFRSPVGVDWALAFMEQFFALLGDGLSIEEAFADVRWGQPNHEPQWVLPLVFARRWEATPFHHPSPNARAHPIRSLLPRAPRAYFTAREHELGALRALLTAGGAPIHSIVGEGGVGKTELALKLVQTCQQRSLPVLWLEQPDRDIGAAALRLIEAVDLDFRPSEGMTAQILTQIAREKLRAHGGLLVFDDVASGRELDALRPGTGWNVLVTSRVSGLLPGVVEMRLQPLESSESQALLSRVAWGADELPTGERDGAIALVARLAGLPLAIEMAGATMRDELLSPAEYLADHDQRLGLSASDRRRVEAVLARSMTHLGDNARLVRDALAVLPPTGARLAMIATASGLTESEAARAADRLVKHNIAHFAPEVGRYRLHPLTRDAVRTEVEREQARWERLLRGTALAMKGIADWVDAPLDESVDDSFARWREVADLFDTLPLVAWERGGSAAEELALALARVDQHRQLTWSPSSRREVLDRAVQMAQTSDAAKRAEILKVRGDVRMRQDDVDGAAQDYDAGIKLIRTLHGLDIGQAAASLLQARGELRVRRGDLAGAALDFDAAIELFRARSDHLGEGHLSRMRGEIRRRQNDLEGAHQDLEDALKLFRAIHYSLGQAYALSDRGEIRARRGDVESAAKDFDESLRLFRAEGSKIGEVNVLQARAFMRQMLGDLERADEDLAAALPIAQGIHYRLGEANIFVARADVLLHRAYSAATGSQNFMLTEALRLCVHAEAILRAIQDSYGLANALSRIATIYMLNGRLADAATAVKEGYPLAERTSNASALDHFRDLIWVIRCGTDTQTL